MVTLSAPPAIPQNVESLMAMRDNTLISGEQIDFQLQIAYELSDSDIRKALDHAIFAVNMESSRPKIITISTGIEDQGPRTGNRIGTLHLLYPGIRTQW